MLRHIPAPSSVARVHPCRSFMSLPVTTIRHPLRSTYTRLPCVIHLHNARQFRRSRPTGARAASTSESSQTPSPSPTIWQRIFAPLANFGYGTSSIWQGGVGVFILTGIGMLMVLVTWARNGLLGAKGQGYNAIFEFPTACGIQVGTAVRVRFVCCCCRHCTTSYAYHCRYVVCL